MQFKRLIITSVCALALQGAIAAQAADDVYVDLSVLNSLQPGDSLFVETQPLFPPVTKAPAKKAVKKKTTKKVQVKKTKPAKVKVTETTVEKSIVILPQTPEIPQPLADNKVEQPKAITVSDSDANEREEIAKVTAPVQAADKSQASAAPVVSIEKESLPPLPEAEVKTEVPAVAEPVVQNSGEAYTPFTSSAPAEPKTSEPVKSEAYQPAAEQASAPVVKEAAPEAEAIMPVENSNKVLEPLIPAGQTTASDMPHQIYFADNSFEISSENADKITSVINTFEDAHKHKIAIYAYNYDNGENSFKKKKLSLDRATEIRSLLLNQGYKNFSIKVINVTDNSEKRNLVEIEEIK